MSDFKEKCTKFDFGWALPQTPLGLNLSAAPPLLFHFSGWRAPNPAGALTKILLAAAGDFSGGGGNQRDLVNGGTSHY